MSRRLVGLMFLIIPIVALAAAGPVPLPAGFTEPEGPGAFQVQFTNTIDALSVYAPDADIVIIFFPDTNLGSAAENDSLPVPAGYPMTWNRLHRYGIYGFRCVRSGATTVSWNAQ